MPVPKSMSTRSSPIIGTSLLEMGILALLFSYPSYLLSPGLYAMNKQAGISSGLVVAITISPASESNLM